MVGPVIYDAVITRLFLKLFITKMQASPSLMTLHIITENSTFISALKVSILYVSIVPVSCP